MTKKKVLFVVLNTGRPPDLASPLFHANALFLLKAYLESRPEVADRFDFQIVDLGRWAPFNLGTEVEQNVDTLQDIVARRPEVIAFSLYLWNVEGGHALARVLKRFAPQALLLAGGPEVCERREFARMFPGFDILVEGDGEIPMLHVLEALARGRSLQGIEGVSFLQNGKYVHNPPATTFVEPDDIPDFYPSNKQLLRGQGFHLTRRGCPYNCAMCLWARQTMRRKSPDKVLAELSSLIASPLKFLTLFDYDLLEVQAQDRGFFDRLAGMVHARRDEFGINFFVNPGSLLDRRLPEAMAALRSHHVLVGVQSTSPTCLDAIGRSWSVRWLKVLEQTAPEVRERVFIELIFPLPGQSGAEFLDSLSYLLGLGYHRLQIFHLCLLRGTRLYEKRRQLGLEHLEHPPYTCTGTPQVGPGEVLRIGVLCQSLNLLRHLADEDSARRPLAEFFRRRPRVIDQLLKRIDRGATSLDVADHVSREVLGRPFGPEHARP
jgi:anaerobic magnesium-protoporphyrin IX monomethyl ester cyclase